MTGGRTGCAPKPHWLVRLTRGRWIAEGVRGSHFRLLAALEQYGALSQAELGRHAGIDKRGVVATRKDLEDGRLARRGPDPADRRRNIVTLTKRGATVPDRLDVVLHDVQSAVLAPLTADERKMRLLSKLA